MAVLQASYVRGVWTGEEAATVGRKSLGRSTG